MTRAQLVEQIRSKRSYLCVGLDPDVAKLPESLHGFEDPVFEFNRRIVDATHRHCVAYKINTAFYESQGPKGWETLEKTVNYLPASHFKIADAKRGDIDNTSAHYARAFFEALKFDAVTVAPYMGEDSIRPFLEFSDKWTIILALTSNPGAADFELQRIGQEFLFERVLLSAARWGTPEQIMFVVGATQRDQLERIRMLTPRHFYLVPGVGAQNGNLQEVSSNAMNVDCGILVNVARSILYASKGDDFAEAAGSAALGYQVQMDKFL